MRVRLLLVQRALVPPAALAERKRRHRERRASRSSRRSASGWNGSCIKGRTVYEPEALQERGRHRLPVVAAMVV
jgi:hypothetical protein